MDNNNKHMIWMVGIIVSIIISFASIIFAMINNHTVQATKKLNIDIIQLYKNQADLNSRLYRIEGDYRVIIEKLDTMKEALRTQSRGE